MSHIGFISCNGTVCVYIIKSIPIFFTVRYAPNIPHSVAKRSKRYLGDFIKLERQT